MAENLKTEIQAQQVERAYNAADISLDEVIVHLSRTLWNVDHVNVHSATAEYFKKQAYTEASDLLHNPVIINLLHSAFHAGWAQGTSAGERDSCYNPFPYVEQG